MRCFLVFVVLNVSAAALFAGGSAELKAYMALKQDSDLYVGEGSAADKDFGGDHAKALAAAQERARGALAESISVHVHSETADTLSGGAAGVQENVKSQTQSQADLNLDNVKLMELDGFPDAGVVTVMASLAKEDYRRQLAGKKVSVYLPEHGFQINVIGDSPNWVQHNFSPGLDLGLDFLAGNFIFGGEETQDQLTAPKALSDIISSDPNGGGSGNVSDTVVGLEAGYNVTPWAMRFQPFIPLRLNYQWLSVSHYDANLFGASAGLGLRYWPADSFAVQVEARYVLGFNSVTLPIYPSPVTEPVANLSGIKAELSLLWSGF